MSHLLNIEPDMKIQYEHSRRISDTDFVDLLKRSTLAERRPVHDPKCIQAMLEHANLLCTAWDGEKLVGVARSVTDFEYCCYLSDLAVDETYQKQGIGRELIRLTQSRLGPSAKIILLAAPKAETYYPGIGFEPHRSAWILSATKAQT
jgi:predicted N-acetyltransferase YhbS